MLGYNTFLKIFFIVQIFLSTAVEARNGCPKPPKIPNMGEVSVIRSEQRVVVSGSRYVEDDVAIYRCSAGFTIADPRSEVTCRSSGEWSSTPECVPAECSPRDEAAAKTANRLCRKRSCYPGDGSCKNTRVCLCDYECGYTCIRLDNYCYPPPNIPNMKSFQVLRVNASGHPVPVTEPPYQYDDIVEYKCNIGFKKERKYEIHRCHGRRRWTGTPECLRACRPYSAIAVKENNMTCGLTCKTDDDCNDTSQCLCDGHCGRRCVDPNVECSAAPESDNAFIEYTGKGFKRIANYICKEGFYIASGTPSRKCTGEGTWDGQLISCQHVQCDDPSRAIEDQNGEVIDWHSGPYFPGMQFTFRCRPSHRLLGSSKRTCMNNGRWSGYNTVCDRKGGNQVRCPHPGVPINGRLLSRSSFTSGTFVEFSCDDGFAMVGQQRQECLYFHQWSGGGAPLCINPKYQDDATEVFNKLQSNVDAIQATIPNPGRFISASFQAGHEIYFLFDLSDSVQDNELNNALTFAIKLIERLSVNATGKVEYGIIVFASKAKVILDTHTIQPPPEDVIQLLLDVQADRQNIKEEIFRGTHTALALGELAKQLAFSYAQDRKKARKRHVFLLTDGLHNEGPPPQEIIKRFTREYQENPPEFYSITSCVQCYEKSDAQPGRSTDAYTELLGLANNKPENFILISNFYLIQNVLDRVTNATIDFSKCGRAGDIGSVKRQASAGRVVNGVQASERAWPWQVSIVILYRKVFHTFNLGFIGGGSVINNRWVLTAAHLFTTVRPEENDLQDSNWTRNIGLVYGLHKRPLARNDVLPPKTRMFDAAEIIIHEAFSKQEYDFDIALIRIGNEIKQNGSNLVRLEYVGFVNYTEYIGPVCLPCLEGNCVGEHLRSTGELTGNETEEERCEIEGNFLFDVGGVSANPLVVTGFGHQDEKKPDEEARLAEYLQQGLIKLEKSERCNTTVREDIPWRASSRIDFTENMICGSSGQAGENVDSCQGDSGGALVKEVFCDEAAKNSQWMQVGIVSWGWGCGLSVTRQEQLRQLPGFYSNVVRLMAWVKKNLGRNETL